MNREETSFWAGTFVPGEVSEVEVSTPYGEGLTLLSTQDAALTNGLAEIPTGLTVDAAPLELRCEVLVAGNPGTEILTHTLTAVASLVASQPEAYPLQPGTVIPMIGARAHLSRSITVRHGVFVPSFMWAGQSPTMTEQPGDVHKHHPAIYGEAASVNSAGVTPPGATPAGATPAVNSAGATPADLGRMTVLLQILMMTDAELNLVDTTGAAGLIDELLATSTNLLDWRR